MTSSECLCLPKLPGWQNLGDDEWKDVGVESVKEMVREYRNHPSIILWGVRINESQDDHDFYVRTNEAAHKLDPTRATGGVRCHKNSELLEDVYTYNDFIHDGVQPGCEPKKDVTSDMEKAYFISEYGGHMYSTKAFDDEEHRLDKPILKLSSSMDIGDHPATNRGRVYIITNADSVRFYKNDSFIHEYKCENQDYPHLKYPPD